VEKPVLSAMKMKQLVALACNVHPHIPFKSDYFSVPFTIPTRAPIPEQLEPVDNSSVSNQGNQIVGNGGSYHSSSALGEPYSILLLFLLPIH